MINKNFYPTPPDLAWKMVQRLSRSATFVLEPSAGSGALLDVLSTQAKHFGPHRQLYAIESDSDLIATLHGKGYEVLGYDFLTYEPENYFNAIVMNPPFENGDEHLLKAIEILRHGEIVCLLNRETIDNPFSAKRKLLKTKLEALGAEIEYLGPAFKDAERRTAVEVVMIYMKIESNNGEGFEYWSEVMKEEFSGERQALGGEIAHHDQIEALVSSYNQVRAEVTKAFGHIQRAFYYAHGIIPAESEVMRECVDILKDMEDPRFAYYKSLNRYLDSLKKDAWRAVFSRTGAERLMSRTVQKQFEDDISKGCSVAFTAENIRAVVGNLFEDRIKIIRESVVDVFEHLCQFDKLNKVHIEGWKTNSSYKVNKKIIVPWAVGHNNLWGWELRGGYSGSRIYADLDRVLAFLAGKNLESCLTIEKALRDQFVGLNRGNIPSSVQNYRTESEFFEIRFFKKGTMHLVWKDEALWARFNTEAARGKMWVGDDAKSADEYTARLRIGA